MAQEPDGFLLKEYEMLWNFTAQLHRERREAVRFLLAALPGIPAALFAAVSIWSGRGTPRLSVADAAPWMLPLLAFLYLVGWSYFMVMTESRARAVEYTRKLNAIRDTLTQEGHPGYRERLRRLDPNCLSLDCPSYAGPYGVDFWYATVVALANSAVLATAAFLYLASRASADGAWSAPYLAAASFVFAVSLGAMAGTYHLFLRHKECPTREKEQKTEADKQRRDRVPRPSANLVSLIIPLALLGGLCYAATTGGRAYALSRAVDLVKREPADRWLTDDYPGPTVDEWLRQEAAGTAGRAHFPGWEAEKQPDGLYVVTFPEDVPGRPAGTGRAWEVDLRSRVVRLINADPELSTHYGLKPLAGPGVPPAATTASGAKSERRLDEAVRKDRDSRVGAPE